MTTFFGGKGSPFFPRAVYAGSFDPITHGHLDIIRRTVDLFGGCSVLAAVNPDKALMFTGEERLTLIARAVIQAKIDATKVAIFNTSEYVAAWTQREIGAGAFLVRGIREDRDLASELAIAQYNRGEGLDTVVLPATAGVSMVSSSGLKKLMRAHLEKKDAVGVGKEDYERLFTYAPPAVLKAVHAKLVDPAAQI